jgi:tetratricopeptide (TPR) repeat protein
MLSQRVVNLRFLGALVAIVVLLAVSVYAVHAIQLRRSFDFLKDEARQAEERAEKDGDYEQPVKFYRMLKEYAPADVDVLKSYGKALAKTNPPPTVRREIIDIFEKVLLKEPNDHEVRRQLIDLTMAEGKYTDARDHLQLLLRQLYPDPDNISVPNPEAAKLEQLLTLTQYQLGERGEAEKLFQRALKHDPNRLETYINYALLLQRDGNGDRARKVFDAMVANNQKNCEAYIARAEYLQQYVPAETERATADLAHAAELVDQELNQARVHLQRGEKFGPDRAGGYLLREQVERRFNHFDRGLEVLRWGEQQVHDSGRNQLLYQEARLLLEGIGLAQENLDSRLDYILNELRAHGGQDLLEEVTARNQVRKGQYQPASVTLEALRETVRDPSRLFEIESLLGLCYFKLKQFDRAVERYKQASARSPGDLDAQVRYASALTATGKFDEGLAQLEALYRTQKTVGAAIAGLLLQRARSGSLSAEEGKKISDYLDAAAKGAAPGSSLQAEIAALRIERAQRRVQAGSTDYADYVLAGSVLAAVAQKTEGDARAKLGAQAEKTLRKAITLPGADKVVEPWAALAEWLHATGKNADALKIVRDYCSLPAADRAAGARLWEAIEQFSEAESLYRQLEDSHRPEATLALAAFLGRRHRLDEALNLCDRAAREGAVPEQMANVCMTTLLQDNAHPSSAQLQKAGLLLETAGQKHPEALALLLHLANLRELQQEYQKAEELYSQVLQRDAQNVLALNNLAWLRAMHGKQPDEALRLVNQAIKRVALPEFLDTRAQIWLCLNKPDEAIQDLQKAIAEKPRPVEFFHLAEAHSQAHHRDEAVAALKRGQKEFGLQKSLLHPLEQKTYNHLVEDLKN